MFYVKRKGGKMSDNCKIYIIWADYDEISIEEFDNLEAAEPRYTILKRAEEDEDGNGVRVHKVIGGTEVISKVIEVKTKHKLRYKED